MKNNFPSLIAQDDLKPKKKLFPKCAVEVSPAERRFDLGFVSGSTAAFSKLTPQEVAVAVSRHVTGDWGYTCPDCSYRNERAVVTMDGPIISEYSSETGVRFFVVTSPDRSSTRIILVDEAFGSFKTHD